MYDIRNKMTLKRILKNTVCRGLSCLNQLIPKNDKTILIYSNQELQHNALVFYEYLLQNHYHDGYQMIVAVSEKKYFKDAPQNVKFVLTWQGILQYFTAKYVVYSHGKVPVKASRGQQVFYIGHGASFKSCGQLSGKGNGYEFYFSKVTCNSQMYRKPYAEAWGCGTEDTVICGEPVTDIFYAKENFYDFGRYRKVVVWTPTFKQSKVIGYSDVTGNDDLIPFFNEMNYGELNQYLEKQNMLLIVKLHGAQNLDRYKRIESSNFKLYSEDDFQKAGYGLYRILKESDALIADFSSILVEYLLLDKPMGFILSDFKDYEKNRGFLFENPLRFMPGARIYSREDFYQFIKSVADGKDDYAKERKTVTDELHAYQDGSNAERLAKLIGLRQPDHI